MVDLTQDDLKSLGLTMGEAKSFMKEAAALASQPSTSTSTSTSSGASSGGSAGVCVTAAFPVRGSTSMPPLTLLCAPSPHAAATLQPTAAPADSLLKATAVSSLLLPSVPMASLPPLTHPCGEPGASGSVFKIEYQGKPAAAKRFHEHMRSMLSRELKSLQLLAHPNIVRVLAVITDAAAQPVGFIMEYVHA